MANLRALNTADEFVQQIDRIISDILTDSYWDITLPNQELAVSASRSPGQFAYHAALNRMNARALFSQLHVPELLDPALRAKKSPLERHHLFPRKYLEHIDITDRREVNQIANFALIEWSDNIKIADKSPAEYFPRYAARFTSDELTQMAYWHALPLGWTDMPYAEFLSERRRLIARVIRDGFAQLRAESTL
ncbi:MAG: hypothetical protein SGI73_10905 [Chloroflexota bacterium]|nr:hypothetical protein [Chloroflexota bacterium]